MEPDSGAVYEIRVKGRLEDYWQEWFEGLALSRAAQDETILRGPLRDQAALYGLLLRVRDVGLVLLEVKMIRE